VRGTGGRFAVKRLRNASKALTPATIEKLRRAVRNRIGLACGTGLQVRTIRTSIRSARRAIQKSRMGVIASICMSLATMSAPANNAASQAPISAASALADVSDQAGNSTPALPPPRELPDFKIQAANLYPERAERKRLQGRVLVEFLITSKGKAAEPRIVQADAHPLLQKAALQVVRGLKFDLPDPDVDISDPTPFRVDVRFCVVSCADYKPPLRAVEIRITYHPSGKAPRDP
jgi:TonB family protein